MALESKMMELGTYMPHFQLNDTMSGSSFNSDLLKGNNASVVFFICNHCPYVQNMMKELVEIAYKYIEKGVKFVAINSNDIENYPLDHPDIMSVVGKMSKFPFPYLFDETQLVAREFDAACTPDFFVFNKDLKLAYRGRFDESRPGNGIVPTGNDIKEALDAIINNTSVRSVQYPSIGCGIKWKK